MSPLYQDTWELASGINSCQLFRMQRRPASSQQKSTVKALLLVASCGKRRPDS